MRAEKSQAVLKTGQNRHKKTPSPEPPFMVGCFFISPAQFVSFIPARGGCKRISWIVAQTMLRQLVSKVQDVDLTGALAHEAPQTFDRIGGLNVSMQGSRELVKRQEVVEL